jgi:virulence factor Mce-like protein
VTRIPNSPIRRLLRHRMVLGVVIAAITSYLVYVSYGAQKGLPGQSIYRLDVHVRDAKQLTKGDQVRIGGARVGFVSAVTAEDPREPYAKVQISIFGDRELPVDTRARVTPISILGGKSIELERGRSSRALPNGGTIPLSRAIETVDLNDAVSTFDAPTRRGMQGLIGGLGDGLAGRGPDVNRTLQIVRPLLAPARRVALLLADPRTDVPGAIDGAHAVMVALRPVSDAFPQMLSDAATTASALNDPALGRGVQALPGAERQTTRTLLRATPVLADAAALTRGLRPAARLLPRTSRRLDAMLDAAVPALRDARGIAPETATLVRELRNSLPPKFAGLQRSLVGLDETVRQVTTLAATLVPAQERCNTIGSAIANNTDGLGEGDAAGTWVSMIAMFTSPVMLLDGNPKEVHRNVQPIADAGGCTVGKPEYEAGKRQTTNPKPTPSHQTTRPPRTATERGRSVGLLTPTPHTRLP